MTTFLINLSNAITASTFDKEKIHFYPYQEKQAFEVFYPIGDLKARLESAVTAINRFSHNRSIKGFQVIFLIDSFEKDDSINQSLTFITQQVRKYFLHKFKSISNVYFINLDFGYEHDTDFTELSDEYKKIVRFDIQGRSHNDKSMVCFFNEKDLQQLDEDSLDTASALKLIFENFKTNIKTFFSTNDENIFYDKFQEEAIVSAFHGNKQIDREELHQRNLSLKTSFKSLIQQYFSPSGNYLKAFSFYRVPFQPQNNPMARINVIAFVIKIIKSEIQNSDNFLVLKSTVDSIAYNDLQNTYHKKLSIEQKRLEEAKDSLSQKSTRVTQFDAKNVFLSDIVFENQADEFRTPSLFFIWFYDKFKNIQHWITGINPQLESLFRRVEDGLSKLYYQFSLRKPDEVTIEIEDIDKAIREKKELLENIKRELNETRIVLFAEDYQLSPEKLTESTKELKKQAWKLPEKPFFWLTILTLLLLPIPFVGYHAHLFGSSIGWGIVFSLIVSFVIGLILVLILRFLLIKPIRKILNEVSKEANELKINLINDFESAKVYLERLFVLKFENKNLQLLTDKIGENQTKLQKINHHITQLKNHKSHYADAQNNNNVIESSQEVDIDRDVFTNDIYTFSIDQIIKESELVQDKIYDSSWGNL